MRILKNRLLKIKFFYKNHEQLHLEWYDLPITSMSPAAGLLKDKYPHFEVGLKCILMVLLCSSINENALYSKNAHECYLARRHWPTHHDPYPEL